jgi:hypothetical protein
MAANPFPGWLAEVAADAIVIKPDDITAEARGNLWTFGLGDDQRADTTLAAVEEFVFSRCRGVRAEGRGGPGRMAFGPRGRANAILLLARCPSRPVAVQLGVGRFRRAPIRVPGRTDNRLGRGGPGVHRYGRRVAAGPPPSLGRGSAVR